MNTASMKVRLYSDIPFSLRSKGKRFDDFGGEKQNENLGNV